MQQICIADCPSDSTLVCLNNILDSLNSTQVSMNGALVSLFMFSFPK